MFNKTLLNAVDDALNDSYQWCYPGGAELFVKSLERHGYKIVEVEPSNPLVNAYNEIIKQTAGP